MRPSSACHLEGTGVISSKVQGRLFSQAVQGEWNLKGFGIPEEGLTVELNVQAGTPFTIRVIDFSYGLPQTGWPPRPANMIAQPSGLSDTTLVSKTIALQ